MFSGARALKGFLNPSKSKGTVLFAIIFFEVKAK
jgi:hypothetical protein